MAEITIVDVADQGSFDLIPPCADERFDHRTCDYWEDADRGSKLHRPSWLDATGSVQSTSRPSAADNPFVPPQTDEPATNPFAPAARPAALDPFAPDDLFAPPLENPFAPIRQRERPMRTGVTRKLALLDRGRGVFGSYAKVLLADGEPAAYCQFGPLSAYPRAGRLRELYAQLPEAPLPAVITCISTTAAARRRGYARRLIDHVCDDLAERGFAAVEAYPDLTRSDDETSAGRPGLWHELGFATAVDDERFPVMRRELA